MARRRGRRGPTPRREPDRNYLQEREMRWREAWEQYRREGREPPRGILVRPGRVPERSPEYLHIRITPERVYVPRWPARPDGSLPERPDMIDVKTLPNAIRHEVHKLSGERNANRKMLRIRRSLEMIHARVVDYWNEMSAEEREETWRHISQLHNALRGGRALSDRDALDRRRAVERLDRLLESRHVGSMAATLLGAANDLTSRRNALLPQMRFTDRMRRVLIERKTELDESAFALLDRISEKRRRVQQGVARRGPTKRDLSQELRRLRSELDDRPEPELRDNAARHVNTAERALRENDLDRAVGSLRKAARAILASNAQYAWLYPSRLDQVAQSRSRRFKQMVAERQMRLFRDHLDYWHSPESHEPLEPSDIRNLLLQVGELVPGTGLQEAARRAEEQLRRGRISAAKEALSQALGDE